MRTTTTTMQAPPVSVQAIWPDSTMAILASGPSMTAADAEYVRTRVDAVIAINRTWELAPWADVLFATDGHWWEWHKEQVSAFRGMKYSMHDNMGRWNGPSHLGVQVLRNFGEGGLSVNPTGLKHGRNSTFQAINLAVLFGASRIILLGVDMSFGPRGQKHWHAPHRGDPPTPFMIWMRLFQTMVPDLKELGVHVVNCSRVTALTVFPRQTLELALP